LRYVAALAQRFQSGAVAADDVTPFPRAVRDSIRAAATQACRNPWRSLAASIGRPVYSDACGSGGCGAVVPAAVGYREVAWRDASGEHINVLEAKAALGALRLSAPPPRGAAVPVVVDNTCVAYQLLRGRGRPAAADDAVRAAYEWAARHGVGLQPVIVPTDCQPADEASRARQPYDKSVVTPPGVRGASLRPRPPPIASTSGRLAAACNAARVCEGSEPRPPPTPPPGFAQSLDRDDCDVTDEDLGFPDSYRRAKFELWESFVAMTSTALLGSRLSCPRLLDPF
jgi:hypothetical protein